MKLIQSILCLVLAIFAFNLLLPSPVFALAGVQTPIPITPVVDNLLDNGSFETGDTRGWQFGNINKLLYQEGAQQGNYWLDTSNCSNCVGILGNSKTLSYDVAGDFNVGQQYVASVYFRSPQGGSAKFVVWELGNKPEVLGQVDKVGNSTWQLIELKNLKIRQGGHQKLRVQIYMENMVDNTQYQFDNIILRAAGDCTTGYYTYQLPLKSDAPTLNDVFTGKAHFQTAAQAEMVRLNFNVPGIADDVTDVWDQKLPILYNQDDGNYYTFTRGYNVRVTDDRYRFNMYLMKSSDGINFYKVGQILDQSVIREVGGNIVDGHIAIDHSVCPIRYVMALEINASLWVSYSTTPFNPASWSKPKKVISSVGGKSASTGVMLIDGNNKYLSWTVVDDNNPHSTYSRGMALANFSLDKPYLGNSDKGQVILPAEANTHCTFSWDCNNRDKQDWKKEGDYYYLLYNGANYYRCARPPGDTGTNDWGIGIVRSTNPLGDYNLSGLGKIIDSKNKETCGVSYPVINNINGELYMYYAYRNSLKESDEHRGANDNDGTWRSKIVWNAASTPSTKSKTVVSISWDGQALDLTGRTDLATKLSPPAGKAIVSVPVIVTYSSGEKRSLIINFNTDTISPLSKVNLSKTSDYIEGEEVTLTFNAQDAGSGVKLIHTNLFEGSADETEAKRDLVKWNARYKGLKPGQTFTVKAPFYLEYLAEDKNGNKEPVHKINGAAKRVTAIKINDQELNLTGGEIEINLPQDGIARLEVTYSDGDKRFFTINFKVSQKTAAVLSSVTLSKPSGYTKGENITVTFNALDTGSGVKIIHTNVFEGSAVEAEAKKDSAKWSSGYQGLQPGQPRVFKVPFYLEYLAENKNGDKEEAHKLSIADITSSPDTLPPTSNISLSPTESNIKGGENVIITFSAQDAGSGVKLIHTNLFEGSVDETEAKKDPAKWSAGYKGLQPGQSRTVKAPFYLEYLAEDNNKNLEQVGIKAVQGR